MQTFQTAAVVGMIDQLSGPLKQLASMAKSLAKTIEVGKFDQAGLNSYTAGLNRANAAAEKHLGILGRMRNAYGSLAKTVGAVVGVHAASRVMHGAAHAVEKYAPLEGANRFLQAAGDLSDADMDRLRRQQTYGAQKYGLKNIDVADAQKAFITRKISAPISEALTDRAIILSRALGVSAEQASKILEGALFAKGQSPNSVEDAKRLSAKFSAIAAVMSKSGAMTGEDIEQYGKYAYAIASQAGIKDETAAAVAMTLKRANMPGMESGTMMRQLASRVMAPTREGREALLAAGINVDSFSTRGPIDLNNLSTVLKGRFGKELSAGQKTAIQKAIEDEGVAGSKEDFSKVVTEAYIKSLGKQDAQSRERITKAAGRYWDYIREGVNGEGLLQAMIDKLGGLGWLNFLGVKQGARGSVINQELDKFRENIKAINEGIEKKRDEQIAAKRNEGLKAASDRLSASYDDASNQLVRANEGWLTKAMDGLSALISSLSKMSDEAKRAATFVTALGVAVVGLKSLETLASGLAAVTGVTGLATAAVTLGKFATGLTALGVAITAAYAAYKVWEGVFGPDSEQPGKSKWTTGTEKIERDNVNIGETVMWDHATGKRIRRKHPQTKTLEDFTKQYGGFDYTWLGTVVPNMRERQTANGHWSEYVRASHDGLGYKSVDADNHSGAGKDIWVKGEVNGSAEVKVNVQVEPTPEFRAKIQGFEKAMIQLRGQLGGDKVGTNMSGSNGAQPVGTATK
jgi:TP901 family phage tail tape measure protein